MNQVGEKINIEEITKSCRDLNPQELLSLLRSDIMKFWSWGSHAFAIDNSKRTRMFRFMVSGHHHKGHVYIFVNGMDLFDYYLTTSQGTIKKIVTDLYFDQLVESIDNDVERIPEYTD